ncbi:hypothetical protein ES703_101016 [subsurface metagenome]
MVCIHFEDKVLGVKEHAGGVYANHSIGVYRPPDVCHSCRFVLTSEGVEHSGGVNGVPLGKFDFFEGAGAVVIGVPFIE